MRIMLADLVMVWTVVMVGHAVSATHTGFEESDKYTADQIADKTDNAKFLVAVDGSPLDEDLDIGNLDMSTSESRPAPVPVYVRQGHAGYGHSAGGGDKQRGHPSTPEQQYQGQGFHQGQQYEEGLEHDKLGLYPGTPEHQQYQSFHEGQQYEGGLEHPDTPEHPYQGFNEGQYHEESQGNGLKDVRGGEDGFNQDENHERVEHEEHQYPTYVGNGYEADKKQQNYEETSQYGDPGHQGRYGLDGGHAEYAGYGDLGQGQAESEGHALAGDYYTHGDTANNGYQDFQQHGGGYSASVEGQGQGSTGQGSHTNQYERQTSESHGDYDAYDFEIEEEFEDELNRNGGGFGGKVNHNQNENNQYGQEAEFGGRDRAQVYLQGFGPDTFGGHQGDDRSTDFGFDEFHDDQYDYSYNG